MTPEQDAHNKEMELRQKELEKTADSWLGPLMPIAILIAAPLRILFFALHCVLCFFLTIFVHPARKRYTYYEYYSKLNGDRPEFDLYKDFENAKNK